MKFKALNNMVIVENVRNLTCYTHEMPVCVGRVISDSNEEYNKEGKEVIFKREAVKNIRYGGEIVYVVDNNDILLVVIE